ncbi:baseplate J/gp47 family protein [Acetobacter oeni]|uniref:Uncharacterized protein n=1 Tax=Acetobacter oeni TaxID=304077 RepID=A0A511XP11_9PROT|nr:baseplate J/gp47 family protein [Acetobacter oeni]MBB3884498.1 putative phage protein gp47/JayE [Acetobacter oeni]NHO20430.1 hypothetical protein [Acetobacter oeni]GBR00560.1 bacteriophage protein [Acetobacter oeni LMG 21952]GEN64691.1 hypothetical protein AOE01nite_29150 [Acetobacter oeni]
MPWSRPTLTDLIGQTQQDVSGANIPGVDGLLNLSVLYTLGYATAGLSNLHYGYQDWIAKQATPWGATGEYADGWGSLKGVTRKAATAAVLSFSFSGTADVPLPAGSSITASNSLIFTTDAEADVDATGALSVQATAADTGTDYNLATGTTVSLSSPVSGITSAGTVVSIMTAGTDEETDATYKTRYLARYADTPQGGAAADYVNWAEAVDGVTRAWCNPLGFGAGSVVVYVMLDDANSAYNGFPQGTDGAATGDDRYTTASGNQLAVADAIYEVQPVTSLVIVCAPIALPIDFTIEDLSPNTTVVQGLIQEALADMLITKGTPLGGTIYPSDWDEAIASVSSIDHFYVSGPSAPVTTAVGSLPTVGTIAASS